MRKQKINTELFPKRGFETSSLFNPPFMTDGGGSAAWGTIKIVSSSNVAHTGTKALEHKNSIVLDAGCGNSGYFAKAMIDLGAKHVYCLDLGKQWTRNLKKGLKEKGFDKDGRCIVEVDKEYFRPTEVESLLGDCSKAKRELGWKQKNSLEKGIKKTNH